MCHRANLLCATLTASLILVAFSGAAVAGPLEDGLTAYKRGEYATAYRLWRPLADQGHAGAQNNVGLAFRDGKGVPQNYVEALKWFRLAADQGLAWGQDNLGLLYLNGWGVPQNYVEALKWFRLAADQGLASGQDNLGLMYFYGQAVSKNFAEAAKWIGKAADQGYAPAEDRLGLLDLNGWGVPQNYAAADKWLRRAAHQGFAKAQDDLRLALQRHQQKQFSDSLPSWAKPKPNVNLGWTPLDPLAQDAPTTLAAREEGDGGKHGSAPDPSPSSRIEVPLKKQGGIFVVPVQINGAITLDFTVDSGAADVSVPADVFSTLVRTGTIRDTDIIGEQTYVLADGSSSPSFMFTIRSLKIGDSVVENVRGGVAPSRGSLLLGQSFLERFKSWSIDNTKHVLLLEPR
jgi:clan AA aspartic protease (TIGR02281 family)